MERPDSTTWAAVFLAVFTLVLFAANLLFTAHEVNGVRNAEASVIQLCQSGNEQNARQIALWDHLLTISAASPVPHETPEMRRFRLAAARALETYVHRVFAARDCTAQFH